MDQYLTKHESYRFVEKRNPDRYAAYGVDSVLVYKRENDSSTSEVQIILLRAAPVVSILRSFYMTAVVNFISCNKALRAAMRSSCFMASHRSAPKRRLKKVSGTSM